MRDAFTADLCVWRAIDIAGQLKWRTPILPALWREVRAFIENDKIWPAIAIVAQMLLECGELAGAEVNDFARYAMCQTG